MLYLIFVLTETHIPENPEHPEQRAPNKNENPISKAKYVPYIYIPCLGGRLRGFYLIPYRKERMTEKIKAYNVIVPYCCLKYPSEP